MEIDFNKLLSEYKGRFRISHSSEDETLKGILGDSFSDIASLVGDFDPQKCSGGKELIFERTRYVVNESLEFFYDNFQQRILDVSLDLMNAGDANGDPT